MAEKEPNLEEIKHNIRLQKWYPLGHVDAMWSMMENITRNIDNKFPNEIEAVLDALQKLDDKIRADRYPFPKKRVKRSNEILRKQNRRTR